MINGSKSVEAEYVQVLYIHNDILVVGEKENVTFYSADMKLVRCCFAIVLNGSIQKIMYFAVLFF